MKLAIGTAQFGLAYGVANRSGQVTSQEAAAIIQHAQDAGLDTLDTAISYGDCEERLGQIGVSGWRIVSKLPPLPSGMTDSTAWAEGMLRGSLARLNVDSIHGILFHRSSDLAGESGRKIFAVLQRLKASGLVGRIGVSIYDPSELDAIIPEHPIDIVQAPFNIVDRRIVTSGWLERLKAAGTEVHVRSAFLQGLLLMNRHQRPAEFTPWSQLWTLWHEWLETSGLTPLQAAIGFVLSEASIDRVVVGVDSVVQLREIIDAAVVSAPPIPAALSTEDKLLINPSNWKLA